MADNSQPWMQQRPVYRPNPPGMSRPPYQPSVSNPGSIPGLGGLTRQERQEAKRLAEATARKLSGGAA